MANPWNGISTGLKTWSKTSKTIISTSTKSGSFRQDLPVLGHFGWVLVKTYWFLRLWHRKTFKEGKNRNPKRSIPKQNVALLINSSTNIKPSSSFRWNHENPIDRNHPKGHFVPFAYIALLAKNHVPLFDQVVFNVFHVFSRQFQMCTQNWFNVTSTKTSTNRHFPKRPNS